MVAKWRIYGKCGWVFFQSLSASPYLDYTFIPGAYWQISIYSCILLYIRLTCNFHVLSYLLDSVIIKLLSIIWQYPMHSYTNNRVRVGEFLLVIWFFPNFHIQDVPGMCFNIDLVEYSMHLKSVFEIEKKKNQAMNLNVFQDLHNIITWKISFCLALCQVNVHTIYSPPWHFQAQKMIFLN